LSSYTPTFHLHHLLCSALYMMPPPPTPTPFPYTTLFRSTHPAGHASTRIQENLYVHLLGKLPFRDVDSSRLFNICFDGGVQRIQDRKSTRLNSSHVKISYAVFCLKKKKKQVSHHK